MRHSALRTVLWCGTTGMAQGPEEIFIMKKRIVNVLQASIVAAALLAGCGGADETGAAATQAAQTAVQAEQTTTEAAEAPQTTAEVAQPADTAATVENLSGTVSTDGSTSMEKVIGLLSESFMEQYPDVEVTYNPTGSGSGVTAAKEGSADIGLASRDLKDDEKDGLTQTTIALDGIAIIVNPENSVEDLSVDQIARIYKGEVTNWSEVGGSDGEIVCIGREAGSGTRDGFETITDTKDSCKLSQELTSTGDVIQTVAGNPNAVGYASLAALNDTIKAVTVDGVAPTEATVLDGSYKIQRNFNIITNDSKELSPAAQAFFDFATGTDAAELISQGGAVPTAK